MEIGSIYEIDPKDIKSAKAEPKGKLLLSEVEKYNKKYTRYTASGREAIALALKSLEERRPELKKVCLLPAYMCDTVFFPFEHAGWELHFYHVGRDLKIQEEELRSQAMLTKPDLLFVHSYYGVDTWKPMNPFLAECRRKGILVMADVTQSYYLPESGMDADYVVGSLRKWYPVPDGGFIASDIPLSQAALSKSREFTEKRIDLLTQKWEYLYGTKNDSNNVGTSGTKDESGNMTGSIRKDMKADYLEKNRKAEEWLDRTTEINAISECSETLLMNIQEDECKRKRNENYKTLYKGLYEDLKRKKDDLRISEEGSHQDYDSYYNLKNGDFVPVFRERHEDAVPLYFSIYVHNRDSLQAYLRSKDIYAPVLWPIGTQNKDHLSEAERFIFDHLLALPMDQRYGKAEMERIIEAVIHWQLVC